MAGSVSGALREQEPDILRAWESHVRDIPALGQLTPADLRDSIPRLIEEIADACDAIEAGRTPVVEAYTAEHAFHRLSEGIVMADLLREFSVLRTSIGRVLTDATPEELVVVHRAIDAAIGRSIVRYVETRERAMQALDRISHAALVSTNLDDLLRAVLMALLETTPAIDTAAVLLREGDSVTVRAAVGLEREKERGFTLRLGEGFSGTIAATGRPLFLRHASADPLPKSPTLRQRGVRALYGVPLVSDGSVVGVANVGSCTSFELTSEVRHLVNIMATRVASAIVQQKLVTELEAQRRRTENIVAELATERARFTQVLEELPVAVYLAEAPSGRVGYANRVARELGRFTRSENPDEYTSPPLCSSSGERIDVEHVPLARAIRGESVVEERVILPGDPGLGDRVLSISTKPILDADNVVREAVSVVTDLTELQQAIAERDARIAGERSAREEAERASRLREDVLAVVSHDLKNPIGAVLLGANAAEIALARADVPHALEAIRRLRRSALRMEELVRDVLDAARIDARELPLNRVASRVSALVIDAIDAHVPIARDQDVSLSYELESDSEISCDVGRIGQVLANLIGNALKFARRGGHVVVDVHERGSEAAFCVSDDGPGIDEALLPHLFERFRRGDASGVGGVGLGLYIAKGIVEAHGGQMKVESGAERGTRFCFTLPRA